MGTLLTGQTTAADIDQLVLNAHHGRTARVEMKQIAAIFHGHAQQLGNVISQLIVGRISQLLLHRPQQPQQQVVGFLPLPGIHPP